MCKPKNVIYHVIPLSYMILTIKVFKFALTHASYSKTGLIFPFLLIQRSIVLREFIIFNNYLFNVVLKKLFQPKYTFYYNNNIYKSVDYSAVSGYWKFSSTKYTISVIFSCKANDTNFTNIALHIIIPMYKHCLTT